MQFCGYVSPLEEKHGYIEISLKVPVTLTAGTSILAHLFLLPIFSLSLPLTGAIYSLIFHSELVPQTHVQFGLGSLVSVFEEPTFPLTENLSNLYNNYVLEQRSREPLSVTNSYLNTPGKTQ